MTSAKPRRSRLGPFGYLGVVMGLGCFAFVVLGGLNTIFNWNLVLRFKGSEIPIPDSWDVVLGLAAVGTIFIAITYFGNFVIGKFKAAKGKPLVRVGILLAAFGLLFVAGRGLQVMALTGTYGSMLAYYCTDGDLDDVKAELAKGATPEELKRSLRRASDYGNTEALKLLVAAGAKYESGQPNDDRDFCGFDSDKVSAEFIEVSVSGGAQPDSCRDGEWLIFDLVRRGGDDAALAKKVAVLLEHGWSQHTLAPKTTARAKGDKTSTLDWAQKHQLTETIAVLEADRAARAVAPLAAPASALGSALGSGPASTSPGAP